MTVVLALVAAAAGALAGYWFGARRRAAGPPPASTPLPSSPARSSLSAVQVLRGEDLAGLAERDARELAEELRPYLVDVTRQHGASEVTLWRHAGGDKASLEIVAWSGDGPPPPAATWGTVPERALVAWSAAEQMVGFERRDDEPRIAICPVRFCFG